MVNFAEYGPSLKIMPINQGLHSASEETMISAPWLLKPPRRAISLLVQTKWSRSCASRSPSSIST